jgi:hypothetical protein
MSKPLDQEQAADLAGMAARSLRSAEKSDDPPPRGANGYPCREFGEWLTRRHLRGLGVAADGQVFDLKSEQARFNHHAANLKQLEEAQLRGDLLQAEEVLEQWQAILANVRARILSLPGKLAPQAYAAHTAQKVEDLLRQGIHEVLEELSEDGKPKTRKRSK